jgi:glycosyltransferase involved in cell wall biosynthesis
MTPCSMSIALCTYNGAAYLNEQLKSIAAQTRSPDELVICDDCSRDDTVRIVRDFAADVRWPVRLHVNPQNLGSTKNFEQAIELCQGSIIVLCDQDDFWASDKLARLEAAFSRPTVGAVFTDGDIADEQLRSVGYRLWHTYRFGWRLRQQVLRGRAFEVLLRRNVVTGATMAFRSQFRDLILPVPSSWFHDAWIALLVAAFADLSIIDAPLIKYRQHSGNQIGGVKQSFGERMDEAFQSRAATYQRYIEQFQLVRERLLKFLDPGDGLLSKVEAQIRHIRARAEIPRHRWKRLWVLFPELVSFRYSRYSNGVLSFCKDLFLDNSEAENDTKLAGEAWDKR